MGGGGGGDKGFGEERVPQLTDGWQVSGSQGKY